MKAALILGAALLSGGCERKSEKQVRPAPVAEVSYPDHFDQAWVMSSGWFGYMGVAIAISGDRYFYWGYSDVSGGGENYPYTGSFRIDDGVLVLGSPSEYTTGISVEASGGTRLYSDRWRILPGTLSVSLHSAKDKPDDVARRLMPDFQFDPSNPFRNQQYLEPEQAAASNPPSPAPDP